MTLWAGADDHLDWPVQKDRILSFVRRYRGRLILDATGVGDPIYDDLKRVYSDVEGFKLTPSSKTELIQRLIVAVEQRRVSWPVGGGQLAGSPPSRKASEGGCSDWEVLTAEMKRYEYAISPSGGISYNAPSGYHDDCVIALALANHRRCETEGLGSMLRLPGRSTRRVGRWRRPRVLAG